MRGFGVNPFWYGPVSSYKIAARFYIIRSARGGQAQADYSAKKKEIPMLSSFECNIVVRFLNNIAIVLSLRA